MGYRWPEATVYIDVGKSKGDVKSFQILSTALKQLCGRVISERK